MDTFDAFGTRPVFTPAQEVERARAASAPISKAFVRYGLTSVHHEGGDLAAMQAIRASGDLPVSRPPAIIASRNGGYAS